MGPDIKVNRATFFESTISHRYNSNKESFSENDIIKIREFCMPLPELEAKLATNFQKGLSL